MNQNDLKPAKEFAQRFGIKCVVFGPPGSGKTPMVNTAPRPVLLATEPGLLSMRNSNVPTWLAPTTDKIDEFMKWFEHSSEAKNFDTLAIDSSSQMCDIALDMAKKKVKSWASAVRHHGRICHAIHEATVFHAAETHVFNRQRGGITVRITKAILSRQAIAHRHTAFV